MFTPIETVLAWSENYCRTATLTNPEIYLWQPARTAVVIGLAQTPEREIFSAHLAADNVALIRRRSGGGAVVLTPSMLCFEAFAPVAKIDAENCGETRGLRASFHELTAPLRAAVSELLAREVGINGISDLTIMIDNAPRKFCGTAQFRQRQNVLVHGAILIAADLSPLARYLRLPSEMPTYRQNRQHHDFCVALATLPPPPMMPPLTAIKLATMILSHAHNLNWRGEKFSAAMLGGGEIVNETAVPNAANKYYDDDWNWRRRR